MLNVIICEDNAVQRKEIESIINGISDFHNEIAISTDNPKEVLTYIDNTAESFIYFLDVELNSDLNGFELAHLIRTIDTTGYIIFLTAHAELTLLTFQYKVQALDYIIKGNSNILKEKILDCFKAVNNSLNISKSKINNKIPIDIGNNIVFWNFDDILFFETAGKGHKISIHTKSGQSEFYGTLKNIEKNVSSDFYKTHRSYLINTKKIKSINKSSMVVEMINGEICYVSIRYLKGLLRKCLHY
ncbi:two component transcriptional regulator, LytTR family [Clostridium sp. DL-VIII]|uniref:LytR/AlgR family response regulator transcription factor n=1 Tax=Clostridium sp. DL-VIII TaxID=641107 RepID=UPI00023AFB26|nr:LytTR family DNA-binding domain-containing protein [Clostridium sp. DL-VIII]EHI99451.1 two component transcriptional regulator, LytTR family [Clostridium sp. DL-VIII]